MVRMLAWPFLLFVCWCLMPAQAQVVDVGSASRWEQRLRDQVHVYQDVSGRMNARQVAALPEGPGGFQPIHQWHNASRVAPHPWWIKVKLANTGAAAQSLRLILNPYSLFHTTDIYLNSGGRWLDKSQRQPAADGPTAARFHTTVLSLEPGQETTALIRTTGVAPADLAPYLYTETTFRQYLERAEIWNGLLFGGLLALGWAALVLAIYTRSTAFLLLGALSLVTLLLEADRRGYATLYLFPDSWEGLYRLPFLLGALTTLLFICFILKIAQAENIRLPLRKLLIAWTLYPLAIILMSAFGDVYQAAWVSRGIRPFFALTLLLIAILFIRQHAPTRKLMLFMATYSVGLAILYALEGRGALPDYIDDMTLGGLRLNPILALTTFLINLTVLAAWVGHVGLQRNSVQRELSRRQAQENERLTKEVAIQTRALNKALKYADEKNRQQTEIVGYVSHDLRAPLATIAGYAKMLEQTARKDQTPHLHAIARSVNYQMTLIDEILAYAKSELRPLSVKLEPTELSDYLDEIAQHATALSARQNNRFLIHTSSRLPKTVWLDGLRLRQVLLNLLSNAAKFTRNGTIVLGLQADRRETGWRLHFVVGDSGIGIDAENKTRVFEAFHQADANTAGVGLGLYITQSILREMSAELTVSSSPGLGSTFNFTLVVPSADVQTISWTAPAALPSVATVSENTAFAEPAPPGAGDGAGPQPVPPIPGDINRAAQPSASPPAQARADLAAMARNGSLTDIDDWLRAMSDRYPASRAYFEKIRHALDQLDLTAIERLAEFPLETGET